MSNKQYTIAQNQEQYKTIYLGNECFSIPSNTLYLGLVNIKKGEYVQSFKYQIDNQPGITELNNKTLSADIKSTISIQSIPINDTAEGTYTSESMKMDNSGNNSTLIINAKKARRKYTLQLIDKFFSPAEQYEYGTTYHANSTSSLSINDHGKISTLTGFSGGNAFDTAGYSIPYGMYHNGHLMGNTVYTLTNNDQCEEGIVYFHLQFPTTNKFIFNGDNLESTNHSHSSVSTVDLTYTAPSFLVDKFLDFSYYQSSELNYDYLSFSATDNTGVVVSTARGKSSGSYRTRIRSGSHTIRITFKKDGSTSTGNDKATLYTPTITDTAPQLKATGSKVGDPDTDILEIYLKNETDENIVPSLDHFYGSDSSMEYPDQSTADEFGLISYESHSVQPGHKTLVYTISSGLDTSSYDIQVSCNVQDDTRYSSVSERFLW